MLIASSIASASFWGRSLLSFDEIWVKYDNNFFKVLIEFNSEGNGISSISTLCFFICLPQYRTSYFKSLSTSKAKFISGLFTYSMETNRTWFSWQTRVAGNSISFILYFNSLKDVMESFTRSASSLNTSIASTFDCLASLLAILVGLGGGGGVV